MSEFSTTYLDSIEAVRLESEECLSSLLDDPWGLLSLLDRLNSNGS